MADSKRRSVWKSIVWRVIATTNGFLVAYAFLGEISASLNISIVANITGLIAYYIHERVWARIDGPNS